jgi:FixJ family two-component response regulator
MGNKIFLIDDDLEFTEAFQWITSSLSADLFIYHDPFKFLEEFTHDGPGCILLDVRLSNTSGFQVQNALKDKLSELPIIFITAHGDIPMAVRAMKNGAFDFFTKPFNNQLLLERIHDAIMISDQLIEKKGIREKIISHIKLLTKREKEVAKWMIEGEIGKVIADKLNTSLNTIDAHRAKILKKMQMQSSAKLIKTILTYDLEHHFGATQEKSSI